MRSFKEFLEEYRIPKYSRSELDKAVGDTIKSCTVNRVIQKGKSGDIALQILAIHDYPGVGRTVVVK